MATWNLLPTNHRSIRRESDQITVSNSLYKRFDAVNKESEIFLLKICMKNVEPPQST